MKFVRKNKIRYQTVRLALLGMNTTDPRKSLPANLFPTALCHLCEVRSIVGTDYGEYFTAQILNRLH